MKASQDTEAVSGFRRAVTRIYWAYNIPMGVIQNEAQAGSLGSPFEIAEGERLGDVLDRLVQKSREPREWRVHNGVVYFLPATGAPINLHRRVTLRLRNVTTRDAILTLVETLNRNPVSGRFTTIYLPTAWERVYLPATPFDEDTAISINARDQPAHEVLAAINAQAPVPFEYLYFPGRDYWTPQARFKTESLRLMFPRFERWRSSHEGWAQRHATFEEVKQYHDYTWGVYRERLGQDLPFRPREPEGD